MPGKQTGLVRNKYSLRWTRRATISNDPTMLLYWGSCGSFILTRTPDRGASTCSPICQIVRFVVQAGNVDIDHNEFEVVGNTPFNTLHPSSSRADFF